MAHDITMTYKVKSLKVRNQTNSEGATLNDAIVQTYWDGIGVDADGNTATFAGATPFTAVDVPEGEFKPFSELTEEIVLGWITDYIDSMPGYLDHIKERIFLQIEQTLQVETEKPLPWDPDATVSMMPPGTPDDGDAFVSPDDPAASDPAL